MKRQHLIILWMLAKYSGATEGEVLDFLLEGAEKDITNIAEKLKETVDKEREKNLKELAEISREIEHARIPEDSDR